MDRFKEQLDELRDAEKDILIFLKERALLVKKNESTGKVTLNLLMHTLDRLSN